MKRLVFLAMAAGTIFLAGCGGGGGNDTQVFRGTLSGSNAVPPTSSEATGTATVTLNDDGSMRVQVNATGLTGVIDVHLHKGGVGTVTSSVTIPLLDQGTPGIVNIDKTFPEDQVPTDLASGTHYIDIHTQRLTVPEVRAYLTE